MLQQLQLTVGCLLIALVSVAPAMVVADQPDNPALVKELGDVLDARLHAVQSVHVVADRLSLGNENVRPLTLEQARAALLQYGATAGTRVDRDQLRRTLAPSRVPADSLNASVEFYSEGARTAELSRSATFERFVTDERATVMTSGRDGQRLHASIWESHRSNMYSLALSSFSWELRTKVAELGAIKFETAGVDETGHFVVTWREGNTVGRMEVSREDGILRSMHYSSKGFDTLTMQAGRIRTREGIPFPAVSARFDFRDGKPRSLTLVAPKSVEANQPIAPEIFRVAAVKGSTILDYRIQPTAPRSVQFDVDDLVEYANSLGNPQGEKPTPPAKP